MILLSREEFKSKAIARDKGRCVHCSSKKNLTVHHIVDRKCFGKNGGYYLANAATLCDDCHWNAEKGILTCDQLRKEAKIETIVLPEGFDKSKSFDKWGKET